MLDNIRMAFASLWANKMRALLTMLGIIIGIGSVIAIVTVGDSLSGSLTDSLQSFGVNNITVSLQQKSESGSAGGAVRMFSMAQPSEEDLITDAMLEEYSAVYGENIYAIFLESSLGAGTVGGGEDTATVQVTGVNAQYADANELDLFYTRNESWTVTATSMESLIEEMTSMLNTVKLAISAIAAISLLVGGIGVMNIMLVSITERTREIGTRKALGARRSDIRLQFITEAVVICLVGGALGMALGVGLGSLGASLLGYAAKPSLSAILVAVGFSMAIGVFFGYYPANKAAKLDPIDALRYE